MFKKISVIMLVITLAFLYISNPVVTTPAIAAPETIPATKMVKVASIVIIKGTVLFDFDSFELVPIVKLILEKIAIEMENAPDTLLILKGHTDKVGSNEYNQILSENRADAVEDYLVQTGIPSERIVSVTGFGKTLLLPEMTDYENRRVIILSVE